MDKAHIFTVEDTFYIENRGVIITGICLVSEVTLLPKQELELVKPDGESVATEVIGTDRFTKCFSETGALGVLVTLQQKEQAPLGTKVYA